MRGLSPSCLRPPGVPLYLCRVATPKKLPSGKWRVRWIDPSGRRRQRQFNRKREADLWAARITQLRGDGQLEHLSPSRITLSELAVEWLHGPATQLAPQTRRTYVGVLDLHCLRWIGGYAIIRITTSTVESWQVSLTTHGVSVEMRRRSLKYLRMLLSFAVARGYLTTNCAASVKMPSAPMKKPVQPLSPTSIERLRGACETSQDRLLISLMGYAGLRPSEAARLTWGAMQERSLIVPSTKTQTYGTVKLLAPLRLEILEQSAAHGRPEPTTPIFQRRNGAEWTRTALNNWRRRIFDPACEAAGIEATPYALRHSFASLLLHAGYPIPYVASQMRHSVEMTMRHYAHVIADLDPAVRLDPEQAILQARGEQGGNRGAL